PLDRRVGVHVLEHLLAGPALGVEPRVGDQTNRAPQLDVEHADVRVRIGVDAELLAEGPGVEAPALGVRGLAGEAAEARQLALLALQRDLEVVARRRLVQVQRLQRPATGFRWSRLSPWLEGLATARRRHRRRVPRGYGRGVVGTVASRAAISLVASTARGGS